MTHEPSILGHGKDIWAWVAMRFVLAWILLWAFFDKLIGLGYATKPGHAWINGVSPTTGYLNFATGGIFGDLFKGLANNPVVDFLFMLALIAIGLALLLGIGIKIAAVAGTLFFGLLWLSALPSPNNPIVDEHIPYIIAVNGIALAKAGRYAGLGKWWSERRLVQRFRVLE